MKKFPLIASIFIYFTLHQTALTAQSNTISEDKDWTKQKAFIKNSIEAEYIIRIGDIDNLGFGWPDGFDPFCGRMTQSHPYPWDVNKDDLPGFDRILLSSLYNPASPKGCAVDGYSSFYDPVTSKPVEFSINTGPLKGVTVNNAYLQIFIDDFQAPSMCSRFQVNLNGNRFAECEKIINAIDQFGPVGKLITIPLPEEFFNSLVTQSALLLKIDEVTGAADGFAIDFIRLLINRKRENTCKGNIYGRVLDKLSGDPIAGAKLYLVDKTITQTDKNGSFIIKDIPTGFEVVSASFPGYNDGSAAADIGKGDGNDEVVISLEKGKQTRFNDKDIKVGETINLQHILFDQGKALIRNESVPELDKLNAFMQSNPSAEIELSGHTSSEGDAVFNRSLSYKRVKACKDYIVAKGIDPGRIIARGFGPDRPLAPNDTEPNRAINRRVEMRVVKL